MHESFTKHAGYVDKGMQLGRYRTWNKKYKYTLPTASVLYNFGHFHIITTWLF
jgi:hypothetical protein